MGITLPKQSRIVSFSDLPLEGMADLRSGDSHLVVCVHGLAGPDFNDLVMNEVQKHLSSALPEAKLSFLMSQVNKVYLICNNN